MLAFTRVAGMGPLPRILDQEGSHRFRRAFSRASLPLEIVEQPHLSIPLYMMIDLFREAGRVTGDKFLGLRVGREMDIRAFGMWASYAASAPTLIHALYRTCMTSWSHQNGALMSLEALDGHVVWTYRNELLPKHVHHQHSDHLIMPMIRLVQAYLGPDWMPDMIHTNYLKNRSGRKMEEILGVDVEYEKLALGIAVRREDLRARQWSEVTLAQKVTINEFLASCRKSRMYGDDGRIFEDAIVLRLLAGRTDIDGLAEDFRVSRRSLQRELNRLGTTYRDMLLKTRMQRATSLLAERENRVSQVAYSLGYEEPENFTRAFRKWSGISPERFRELASPSARPSP